MKTRTTWALAALIGLAGCGGGEESADQAASGTETAGAILDAAKTAAAGETPDPCDLLSAAEAATVFGAVHDGVEETFAIPGIRKCNWDAADGSYGVGLQLTPGGIAAARKMVIGEVTELTDLGAPGFAEMLQNGWLVQVAVDAGDYAVHVIPFSMEPHGLESEAFANAKQLAIKSADRL